MEFSFNDNQVVESIESVPEDFRGLYVESEGKFKLNTEDGPTRSAVAAVTRLNQALKASRAEAKAAKGKKVDLSPLAEYGEEPATILETFTTKLNEAKKLAKGTNDEEMQRQIEKIKGDLAKAHAGDIEKRDKRIEALTGQLNKVLVKGEAVKELTTAKVIDADLALPFVQSQVKVTEEDGVFNVYVVDKAGDIRYSGVTGAPMSIKELVDEMKKAEKFAPLFKSDAPVGGGALPTSHTPRQGARSNGEMSSTDKIKAGLAKGQYSRGVVAR